MDLSLLQAALLGALEGVTEFLPISSTGHLILASALLGIAQTEFVKTFEIAIQLGAILAVVALYWRSFLNGELLGKLFIAFVPTAVIGLIFYETVKATLIGNTLVVVYALFWGGIVFILFEWWRGRKEDAAPEAPLTYFQAFLVGIFQALAIIPGVSRSGATILGGMALGVARTSIVEFSFLLAVPTMLAATGLDMLESSAAFTKDQWSVLLMGFVTAFLIAIPSIRWLIAYVRDHSFVSFGVYRIVLAAAFFLFIL